MSEKKRLRPNQEDAQNKRQRTQAPPAVSTIPDPWKQSAAVGDLDFFDVQCIQSDASIVQYGKRGVGKSTLLRYMVYYNRYKWDEIYVFTKSYFNGFYQEWVRPEHHVFPGTNNEVLRMIMDENVRNPKKVLVILDDILSADGRELRYSKELLELFTMGRHYGIALAVNTQYPKALPPTFRDNVDYAFIFIIFSKPTFKMLYEAYGGFLDIRTYTNMFYRYTQNKGALVACAQRNTIDPKLMFNYVRASPHPAFTAGGEDSDDDGDEKPLADVPVVV